MFYAKILKTKKRDVPPFRYVIVENRIEKDENTNEKCRVIEVLLDDKAFSENVLRALFQKISKRYPDDELLDVWVHTSLEDVPTPEERDEGTTSERRDNPGRDHYRAVYLRSREDEYFRYSRIPNKDDIITVQIRKPRN